MPAARARGRRALRRGPPRPPPPRPTPAPAASCPSRSCSTRSRWRSSAMLTRWKYAVKARTTSRAWSRDSASVRASSDSALGPEVPRPRVLRAQGLGARAVLLDEREAGLALALLQHVAEQAAEGVDVAAERIVVGLFGRRGVSSFGHLMRAGGVLASQIQMQQASQSVRPPPRPEPAWAALDDEALLDVRMCDLGLDHRGQRAGAANPGARGRAGGAGTGLPAALLAVRRVVLPRRRARASPFPSTSRTPASRAWSRRRCWRSRAAPWSGA